MINKLNGAHRYIKHVTGVRSVVIDRMVAEAGSQNGLKRQAEWVVAEHFAKTVITHEKGRTHSPILGHHLGNL